MGATARAAWPGFPAGPRAQNSQSGLLRANSTVSLNLHSHSELHFDVDWLHIHDDKTWDKDVYSSGDVDLEQKCIHI